MKKTPNFSIVFSLTVLLFTIMFTSCASQSPTTPPQGIEGADEATAEDAIPTQAEEEKTEPAHTEAELKVPDGCLATEQYEVTMVDGVHYLNYFNGNEATEEQKMACQTAGVFFPSITDMYNAIRQGGEALQEASVKATFLHDVNGIPVCNPDQLYRPVKPIGIGSVKEICWMGTYYSFSYAGVEDLCGSVDVICYDMSYYLATGLEGRDPRAYYRNSYEKIFERYPGDNENGAYSSTVVSRETGTYGGQPCESVTTTSSLTTNRSTRLTVQDGDRNVTIIMRYLIACDPAWQQENDLEVSDTVPWAVFMYWDNGTDSYQVNIYDMVESPTLEWLLSFDVAAYTPGEVAA